jgi:hypothetical protein
VISKTPLVTNKCVYLLFVESAVRFLVNISFDDIRKQLIQHVNFNISSVVSVLSINYVIVFDSDKGQGITKAGITSV